MEWEWRAKKKGVDDPGGIHAKVFTEEERQQILDMANADVLPARQADKVGKDVLSSVTQNHDPAPKTTSAHGIPTEVVQPAETQSVGEETAELMDAPLVRIYNFLRASIDAPSHAS